VEVSGGGPGLVAALTKAAHASGVQIEYGAHVRSLISGDNGVTGVRVQQGGVTREEHADAVILASGGFQANTAWRTQFLGPNWDLAKVRGTQFNTGDGHRMALDIGASPAGNWSGCHAVGWERNAPEFGDMAVGDHFQKHSYPFGVMVNADGRRFVDEGADFRNYTYAKYGRRILEQPGQFAWQIFDQKVVHLLRDEYRIKQVTKVTANTLEELAGKLEGVDPQAFLDEVKSYNSAVDRDVKFNPNVKDGRRTVGLTVDKTNWANTLDEGPFEAYAVTCGITFTFGGLRINGDAEVLDTNQQVIPGLYAAGEIVGGIFYFNYPGGSGLTNGSVFGQIAGSRAAS
jgi:tricarballylate dehydrogenase